jgi:lipopolysaccharide transport system ATP-binding protein
MASLLEVGTGFHPELSGRENVYLNGAILGMKKAEIRTKFDEIIAFAELERFVDTAVKYYSSGMYIRLAFAVAAHLEPEILLVDEVLAVGDAAFQQKCLGKMDDVAKSGRTVLFVSHNMHAVQSLCNVGMVLNRGRLERIGGVAEALHYYHEMLGHANPTTLTNPSGLQAISLRITTEDGNSNFSADSGLVAEMGFFTNKSLSHCYLNFVVEDLDGRFVIHSRTDVMDLWPTFDKGLHRIQVEIPRLSLRSGIYTVWFRLYVTDSGVPKTLDSERAMLEVNGPQVAGLVDVPCRWSWTRSSSDSVVNITSYDV